MPNSLDPKLTGLALCAGLIIVIDAQNAYALWQGVGVIMWGL